jgi:probable HAF family extracellular repeat protein
MRARPTWPPERRRERPVHRVLRLLSSAALVSAAMFTGSPAAAATGYTITDLGTLGGDWTRARGINAAGDVAGTSALSTAGSHAFRWKGGLMTGIQAIGGLSSEGLATARIGTSRRPARSCGRRSW